MSRQHDLMRIVMTSMRMGLRGEKEINGDQKEIFLDDFSLTSTASGNHF